MFFFVIFGIITYNNYICCLVGMMLHREEFFFNIANKIFKQLGFELAILCVSRNKNTEYHTYQQVSTEHCVENQQVSTEHCVKIKYTIENNDGDLDDIKKCTIEMTFEPSSCNEDENEEVANEKTFIITGFKIVDAINNQLIIEPIGDEQKIVMSDKESNKEITNDLSQLDKSKNIYCH